MKIFEEGLRHIDLCVTFNELKQELWRNVGFLLRLSSHLLDDRSELVRENGEIRKVVFLCLLCRLSHHEQREGIACYVDCSTWEVMGFIDDEDGLGPWLFKTLEECAPDIWIKDV